MSSKYEKNKAWRQKYPDRWRASKKRNYDRGAVECRNSREKWTHLDEQLIVAIDRPTDRVLSLLLGRSVRAIQKRRSLIHG